MKKLVLALSLVVFLFGVSGCEKSPVVSNGGEPPVEEYPVEVPFERYSQKAPTCQFSTLPQDISNLTVINSTEDLEKYIECFSGVSYPEIDFSRNTLLVAKGPMPQGSLGDYDYKNTKIKIMQNTADEYTVRFVIYSLFVGVPSGWEEAVIVPKIDSDAKITLDVVGYNGE